MNAYYVNVLLYELCVLFERSIIWTMYFLLQYVHNVYARINMFTRFS